MTTEPQTDHRYGYPEDPPQPEPAPEEREEHRHRAVRPAESSAQLVLRAVAWAGLGGVIGWDIWRDLLQQPASLAAEWAVVGAALGVMYALGRHRRRQR